MAREQRTVRSMHEEAMNLAEAADLTDDPVCARNLFRRAARLERKCVAIVRDIPGNEPTYSILRESLASLEASATGDAA